MKTIKIVLITILCGLIVLLGAMLGYGVRAENRGYHGFGNRYELAKEWEVPASDIESLYINYGMNSNDVYLYEGTGDNIVIREYTNFKDKEEWLSTVGQEGSRLVVRGQRRSFGFFHIGGFDNDAYVEIYLPSGIFAEIEIVTTSGDICSERDFEGVRSFAVESSSGDIRFQSVEAGKITANASSGSITFDYAVGAVSAHASSGDICFRQITGDTVISTSSGDIQVLGGAGLRNISASSGTIRLADVDGRFSLKTTSGEICLEGGKGYGEAEASSGDVSISLYYLEGNLRIGTTSGDVSIKIPADTSFAFVFESASGDCSTFFDEALSFNKRGTSVKGDYGSSPDKTISISTSSGSAYIRESR